VLNCFSMGQMGGCVGSMGLGLAKTRILRSKI